MTVVLGVLLAESMLSTPVGVVAVVFLWLGAALNPSGRVAPGRSLKKTAVELRTRSG